MARWLVLKSTDYKDPSSELLHPWLDGVNKQGFLAFQLGRVRQNDLHS